MRKVIDRFRQCPQPVQFPVPFVAAEAAPTRGLRRVGWVHCRRGFSPDRQCPQPVQFPVPFVAAEAAPTRALRRAGWVHCRRGFSPDRQCPKPVQLPTSLVAAEAAPTGVCGERAGCTVGGTSVPTQASLPAQRIDGPTSPELCLRRRASALSRSCIVDASRTGRVRHVQNSVPCASRHDAVAGRRRWPRIHLHTARSFCACRPRLLLSPPFPRVAVSSSLRCCWSTWSGARPIWRSASRWRAARRR